MSYFFIFLLYFIFFFFTFIFFYKKFSNYQKSGDIFRSYVLGGILSSVYLPIVLIIIPIFGLLFAGTWMGPSFVVSSILNIPKSIFFVVQNSMSFIEIPTLVGVIVNIVFWTLWGGVIGLVLYRIKFFFKAKDTMIANFNSVTALLVLTSQVLIFVLPTILTGNW